MNKHELSALHEVLEVDCKVLSETDDYVQIDFDRKCEGVEMISLDLNEIQQLKDSGLKLVDSGGGSLVFEKVKKATYTLKTEGAGYACGSTMLESMRDARILFVSRNNQDEFKLGGGGRYVITDRSQLRDLAKELLNLSKF